MSRKNIFENVEIIGYEKHINEAAIGGGIALTTLLKAVFAGWIIASLIDIGVGTYGFIKKSIKGKKKKDIIKEIENDNHIGKFIEKESPTVKSTNLKDLLSTGIINKKQYNLLYITSNTLTINKIINKNNEVLACGVYGIKAEDDSNFKMLVNITPRLKDDKMISLYLCGLLEENSDVYTELEIGSSFRKLYEMI